MIGTHEVNVYADPSDTPTGTPVDITCLCDDVAINHGRGDSQSQPEAASATLNVTVGPGTPLPPAVEIGSWVTVTTTVPAGTFYRFVGRVTDVSIGWDDAGENTPESGVGQIVAVSRLADFARRMIGDEPWPQELDGDRVARVFSLAGVSLDPAVSDPGIYELIPRDVDRRAALEIAHDAANSAGGLVWHTRDGEIRYADANHRRGHDVDLDLDACNVLVTPTWKRDLTGLVNEVSMTYGVAPAGGGERPSVFAVNEPSQAKYGRYEYSSTVELAETPDALAAAAEIVGMNGTPDWLLSNMPLDVAGLDETETTTLLSLEMHDLIRVGGLPATGPTPTSIVAWVEGWTESLAWGLHEIELIVSGYCRTNPPARWNDVPDTYTWDTFPADRSWDSMFCFGPPANLGMWDQVAATTRWDQVPADVSWDETGSGIPDAVVTS